MPSWRAHSRLQGIESTLIPTATVFSDFSTSRFFSSETIWAAQCPVQASGWKESRIRSPMCSRRSKVRSLWSLSEKFGA